MNSLIDFSGPFCGQAAPTAVVIKRNTAVVQFCTDYESNREWLENWCVWAIRVTEAMVLVNFWCDLKDWIWCYDILVTLIIMMVDEY